MPDTIWVLWGLEPSAANRFEGFDDSDADEVSSLCRQAGDATILKVTLANGEAKQVTTWKALTSCHEIFYSIRPSGDIFVSDQFRNILSLLPVSDRHTSKQSITDYFLFNTVPGVHSYCSEIQRLGQGERLEIDLRSGRTETSIFDRIDDLAEPGSIDRYVTDIDQALSGALEPLCREGGVVNLFSGGVDSSLMQTYLSHDVPALHILIESLNRDSQYETDYAQRSAEALGIELRVREIKEADYLDQLEDLIEAMAMPPSFLTMVFFREAFLEDDKKFISGDLADSLFGSNLRLARAAWQFASPMGLFFIRRIARVFPFNARPGARLLAPSALSLSQTCTSPFGFGAQRSVFTDYHLAESIFGPELIRERLVERLNYMTERTTLSAPASDRFFRHIEIAQWINYLCTDHVMLVRQLAHAYGKDVFVPFLTRGVFQSAARVPVDQRYIKGFEGKYLLKMLLKKRLPGYPVNRRKGYSNVSFDRYYKSGPLADIWNRYDVPDFIQGVAKRRILEDGGELAWHALTYAIWKKRVVENEGLAVVANSSEHSWRI